MTATIVSLDARAVRATMGVVSQVAPADLGRPTPCGDWTLGELLSHMIAQHHGFAAAAADGVLDRELALPEISPARPFPAAQAISFHFVDYVVHGWDVARSIGVDYGLETDLLAAALPVVRAVPDGEQRRAPGAAFAPGLAVHEDMGALDQILAMLGRRPSWPA
jgi:Mycothiol maleylpyruvate isomerase N-terminal domain